MTDNEKYIKRCFELALNGLGYVAPNPLVGCVIVYKEVVIGEGYHQKFGEAHAEVNAIKSVKYKELLKESTLYVNLEPCAHYGKTPPCANLIIENKIPNVVICNTDPFEKVSGKGIELLRNHNIKVETGILENEGKELNKRFFTWINKKRPYIILKWAQSSDGFIWNENQSKISNTHFDALNHLWRTQESAILVGKNTALKDNPQLSQRLVTGPAPARIVADSNLELPLTLNLFDHSIPTVVLNKLKEEKDGNIYYKKLYNLNTDSILNALYDLNLQSVIIEGGEKLLNSFIKDKQWDEARVLVSTQSLHNGLAAPVITNEVSENIQLSDNNLYIYKNTI